MGTELQPSAPPKRDELEPLRVVLGALHGRPDNAPDIAQMAHVVECLTAPLAAMCCPDGYGEIVLRFRGGKLDTVDLHKGVRAYKAAS